MEELVNNQSNLDMPLEDLKDYVKRIISSYCPYVKDRVNLIDDPKAPEFDIHISCASVKTSILFLAKIDLPNKLSYLGTVKASIPERAMLDHPITFDELSEIIDFVHEDHNELDKLNFYKLDERSICPYEIDMVFNVIWPDFEGEKLYCRDIGINVRLRDGELANSLNQKLQEKYKPGLIYKYTNKR